MHGISLCPTVILHRQGKVTLAYGCCVHSSSWVEDWFKGFDELESRSTHRLQAVGLFDTQGKTPVWGCIEDEIVLKGV